jgi:hypothetical protein
MQSYEQTAVDTINIKAQSYMFRLISRHLQGEHNHVQRILVTDTKKNIWTYERKDGTWKIETNDK